VAHLYEFSITILAMNVSLVLFFFSLQINVKFCVKLIENVAKKNLPTLTVLRCSINIFNYISVTEFSKTNLQYFLASYRQQLSKASVPELIIKSVHWRYKCSNFLVSIIVSYMKQPKMNITSKDQVTSVGCLHLLGNVLLSLAGKEL